MALIDKLTCIADAIRSQTNRTDKMTLDEMANAIYDISGVSDLTYGFEILTYSNDDDMFYDKGKPYENVKNGITTIGIISPVNVTHWCISSVRPSSLLNGAVWIQYGAEVRNTTGFPVIADRSGTGAVILYPMAVEQYIDGQWIPRHGRTCQGFDMWFDWSTGNLISV